MSIFDNITVGDGSAPTRSGSYDPVRIRRRKLADALAEQSALLAANMEGRRYTRTRVQKREDLETEETVEVERRTRVSQWWWINDQGSVELSLRHGSARLKVKDGKDTIILADEQALADLLPKLRQEAIRGGFDQALADAAAVLEKRFKARAKPKGAKASEPK